MEQSVIGDVLVLTLDNPPNNGLTPGMRQALIAALDVPGGITKVVICGAGRVFSGGLALDVPDGAPTLRDLCDAVDRAPVPVVVAVSGNVIGPGAELALAAHARVAEESARLSFMDSALGLISEAGATLRLPRLLGAKEALRLLLSGRSLGATEALAIGLIDHVVEKNALAAALSLLLTDADRIPVSRRTSGLRDPVAHQRAVAQARAEVAKSNAAGQAAIDCVDAALVLTFEQASTLEATLRADLEATPEAAGLKSALLAERRAATVPGPIAAAKPKAVSHLVLVGVGAGLSVLAFLALSRGFRVSWVAEDREKLKAGLQTVASLQEAEVSAGRLAGATRDADWSRLTAFADLSGITEAGMIFVSQAVAQSGAIPALDQRFAGCPLVVIGGAEGRVGMAIAPTGRACELAFTEGINLDAAAAAITVARRLALFPVLVGKAPVLGQRVMAAGQAALNALMQAGVAPHRVMEALEGCGFAAHHMNDPLQTGTASMALGEIRARWLAAMANEGYRLLALGVARRPSDIDHCLVVGHHFPRALGGPMHQAGLRGLLVLRADLRRWQGQDPVWAPAPLIDKLISDGKMMAAFSAQ